jgi:hypothetical protein
MELTLSAELSRAINRKSYRVQFLRSISFTNSARCVGCCQRPLRIGEIGQLNVFNRK